MSFAILAGIFGLITTILWLVIGWRAMRAHESLAESTALLRREVAKLGTGLAQNAQKSNELPRLAE